MIIKDKDTRRWLAPVVVTCISISLSVLEAGCSGISGFRSVGTERPSLRDFWDRPAGTPTAENDTYAMSMRAGKGPAAEIIAKENNEPSPDAGDAGTAGRVKVAETSGPSGGRTRSSESSLDPENTKIRVSLGRPEPLPGVGLALASKGRQTPSVAPSQWKADDEEPSARKVAGAGRPEKRSEPEKAGPVHIADRQQNAHNDSWKALLSRAEARLNGLQTYQMRVSRIERVNGSLQPEEEILLSVRRSPKAVRLEWESGPSRGREVIYSSAADPRMIFVHMPTTAISLPVMKFPVDSPLVMRNSRHSITEAGLDTIVENLRKASGATVESRSTAGKLSYTGTETPSGIEKSCHHFVRVTPGGETWNVYLDERSLLPAMVVANDSRGTMMERYVYADIRENLPELAAAGAFEPDGRWGESKGLLSRLARAAGGTDLPSPAGSTTR